MRRRNVRLHLLAIGEGPGLPALGRLAETTGGSVLREADPARWAEAARTLLRRAAPDLLRRDPVRVEFVGELRGLPQRDVALWNRTWLKPSATALAAQSAGNADAPVMAAWWAVGEGSVASAAFAGAPGDEIAALLRLTRRPPHDPRFRVTWDAGRRLRVTVDAVELSGPTSRAGDTADPSPVTGDSRITERAGVSGPAGATGAPSASGGPDVAGGSIAIAGSNSTGGSGAVASSTGTYLNGLQFSLYLADSTRPYVPPTAHRIPQTAPARYELSLDAPRVPTLATVRLAGSAVVVGRVAVAGRYAPEFDAVGTDRAAIRELAARTGGAVVEPAALGPLDLPRPRRDVPLTSPLAAAAAACVALALVRWRRS
jgi:hypothetical protein